VLHTTGAGALRRLDTGFTARYRMQASLWRCARQKPLFIRLQSGLQIGPQTTLRLRGGNMLAKLHRPGRRDDCNEQQALRASNPHDDFLLCRYCWLFYVRCGLAALLLLTEACGIASRTG
jgi:hypothetical protein